MLKQIVFASAVIIASAAQAHEGACAPINDIKFSTPPKFETKSYRFRSDDVELEGCLYFPQSAKSYPVLVESSGSDEGPTAGAVYTAIHAKALAAKGVAFFAINRRGAGGSGGSYTGTNFKQRAADLANAVKFVRTLPGARSLGVLALSQGVWDAPSALRPGDGVKAMIFSSPSGVNPFEQVAYFIHQVALRLGLNEAEAAKAEALHRSTVRYYATGKGYAAAQALATTYAREPWFEKFRTNEDWDEHIGPGGKLLTPVELRRAWKAQPQTFEFYRSPSTYADYRPVFALLDRPTLMAMGTGDTKVPFAASKAAIEQAIKPRNRHFIEFKAFEGADHGMQDGPRVRGAYLDYIAEWAAQHLIN